MNDQNTQTETQPASNPTTEANKPYARNWKKWIPAYILIALVLYGGVYLVLSSKKDAKPYSINNISPTVTQTASPLPTSLPTIMPTTSSNIPADWKTYTSNNDGYALKYPSDYSISGGEGQNTFAILSPLNPTKTKGYELQDGELKIEIYSTPSPENDSLERYIDEQKNQSDPQSVPSIAKIIAINGMSAAYIKASLPFNGEEYIFIHNNKRFFIVKFPQVTSRQIEFDQILSTFKFTN